MYNSFVYSCLDNYGRLYWVYQTQSDNELAGAIWGNEWRDWTAKDSLDLCLTSEGMINTAWWSHDLMVGHGLESHLATSLLSDWTCPDGWHLLSCNTFIHGGVDSNRRKWGCPGPALYPSEGVPCKDYVGLCKVIMQNSWLFAKSAHYMCHICPICNVYIIWPE